MQGNSWAAAQVAASQEGLISMELDNSLSSANLQVITTNVSTKDIFK
jgi:hypothetical protein